MKKIKNFVLKAGFFGASILPVATVISCSNQTVDDDLSKISIAMRATDYDYWIPIMEDFEEITGVEVEFRVVSDQKADYNTWYGANSLPTILLMDNNSAVYARENEKWVDPIDLDYFKSKELDIIHENDDEKVEFDIEDPTVFMSDTLDYFKFDSNSVVAIPYSISLSGVFLNENNLDLSKALNAYLPQKDGSFEVVEVVPAGQVTLEIIEEFVLSSGLENESNDDFTNSFKLDSDIIVEFSDISSNDASWYDYGPYAYYQRLGSISKSLSYDGELGWIKDLTLPFELIAALPIDDLYDGVTLNDDVLESVFTKEGVTDSVFQVLYESYFGYFNYGDENATGKATSPKEKSSPGEADLFWAGVGNIMCGQAWQMEMIEDNYYEDNFDDSFVVIPAMYSTPTLDSLGVSKNLSDEKKELAYQFIRFVLEYEETKNSYNVLVDDDGNFKVSSTVIGAQEQQKESVSNNLNISSNQKDNYYSLFDSGSSSETYNGVSGFTVGSSSEGAYEFYTDTYNNSFALASIDNEPKNYDQWKLLFESFLPDVFNELAIAGL